MKLFITLFIEMYEQKQNSCQQAEDAYCSITYNDKPWNESNIQLPVSAFWNIYKVHYYMDV